MTNIKLLTASLELIENEFFNTLTVSAVIWKNDENYAIQAISKNISKILGFSQENFINKKTIYSDLIHPDDLKRVISEVKNNISEKKLEFTHEPYRIRNNEGIYKWIKIAVTVIYDKGEVSHFIGYISDCTLEKELLIEKEKDLIYYQTLIDNLPMLIWLKDKNSNFLAVNQSFANATTINEPSLIVGKNDFDVWSDEKLAKKYVHDDKLVLKSGKSKLVKEKILDKDQIKWFETFKAPVYNKEKKLLGTLGYAKDITNKFIIEEKMKSQYEQLELEKTKLSTIVSSLPDALWIKDADGKYLTCNKRFEDLYGAKQSEIVGKFDKDFVDEKLAESFRENDIKAMKSDVPLSNYEELTYSKDGHTEYSHTIKTKVMLNDGSIYGVLGISRDISEIKKYQDKIIEQKEEFETIFNFSKDGIAIIDLESNFLNCNESYCEMLEYPKEELLKKSCIELTVSEDKEKTKESLKKIINDNFIINFEKKCLTKNNNIIYVNMSVSLLPDKKRILIVTKNISDMKFIEEQSKLVSMGEMIGNIAHQWRQPLSIISTASTGVLFQKEYGLLTDKVLIDSMNSINNSAQYLSKTIDDFRNFIKNDKTEEITSIKDAIAFTINLTEASLKNNYINLIVNCEADMTIHAIKNELVQCFLNIINNAKDALVTSTKEENRFIVIETKEVKNNLELSIKDSAGGIPDEIIGRIFEPYFTTKHKSLGTGIGLSIVNKILRDKYCANVTVYNESFTYNDCVYYGACFKITFNKEDLSNE